MEIAYTDLNAKLVDVWVENGWEWGKPIDHDTFVKAKAGEWSVLLTPTKPVPRAWFGNLQGARLLGLASGGGQQMPVFTAAGARCTVLDYAQSQLDSEAMVAQREGYNIDIVRADMALPLPFADESFDIIFHPVSNCYVEDVYHVWNECARVLKKGGILLAGLDNSINYAFGEDEQTLEDKLPYNPLKNPAQYEHSIAADTGIQFSHSIEEQIGGQLKAGFMLMDIYEDTNGIGLLHEHGVPCYYATCAVKK